MQRTHHGFCRHAASHAGMLRRYVPVPKVAKEDRLLFMPLPVPGLYRCVARYGYDTSQQHFQSAALCMMKHVAGMAGSLCAAVCNGPVQTHCVLDKLQMSRIMILAVWV